MIVYIRYALVFSLIAAIEWRCKGPIKIDYESAVGTVIGREKCSSNVNSNAWLINLQPLGSHTYGAILMFDGKNYNNVVKVYTLDTQYQDQTKTFIFDFYQRDALSQPTCDVGTSVSVPQIVVIAVHNKG